MPPPTPESDAVDVTSLACIASRPAEEVDWLWNSDLPPSRDHNKAEWDSLLSFVEDAALALSSRPGHLVTTPRVLLRSLKLRGREPRAGAAVVAALVARGDFVLAPRLEVEDVGVLGRIKGLVWGKASVGMDDEVVSSAAVEAVAARAKDVLGGPVSSDDIHTVRSFARELTGGRERDAEAVIAKLAARKEAVVLRIEGENGPVYGMKFGAVKASTADEGVLQTKAALGRMEVLVEHLEESVDREKAAATALARKGDKAGALARLRKTKLLGNKLAGARATVHKLTDVLMSVDEAATQQDSVQALEIGMESLRVATATGVSAERVDAIAADYAEHTGNQEDVRAALQQLNTDPVMGGDTAEEEAELAAMMAAEDGAFEEAPVKGSAEEEAELDRIMTELGIEKGDTATLPSPPSPQGNSPEKEETTVSGRVESALNTA